MLRTRTRARQRRPENGRHVHASTRRQPTRVTRQAPLNQHVRAAYQSHSQRCHGGHRRTEVQHCGNDGGDAAETVGDSVCEHVHARQHQERHLVVGEERDAVHHARGDISKGEERFQMRRQERHGDCMCHTQEHQSTARHMVPATQPRLECSIGHAVLLATTPHVQQGHTIDLDAVLLALTEANQPAHTRNVTSRARGRRRKSSSARTAATPSSTQTAC